ncbi:hypothetical protein MD484_g4885, partial [Candolleomyces efflorescens]
MERMTVDSTKDNVQCLRRSTRLKLSRQNVVTSAVSNKNGKVQAVVDEETRDTRRKVIQIKLLPRKGRGHEAKKRHPKPPSIIRAGPITATRKTDRRSVYRLGRKDLKRRSKLKKKGTFIGLERKISRARGYHRLLWQARIKNTEGHQRREREWKARGANVPKDHNIQREAVWTDAEKRFSYGTPKVEPSLRQMTGSTPTGALALAVVGETAVRAALPREIEQVSTPLGPLIAQELERRPRLHPLSFLVQSSDTDDTIEAELENQEKFYTYRESAFYFMPYDNEIDNEIYWRQSGAISRFATSSIRGSE